MKQTILAGHHYSTSPLCLPWVGEPAMSRLVTFDESCRYDSKPYNREDVNKLFGLSFGLGKYVPGVGYISPAHWNSARFGWRWSNADQCVELLAYCYTNGKHNWDEQLRYPVVAQVQTGISYLLSITLLQNTFEFEVRRSTQEFVGFMAVSATLDLPHYGLTHGFYFGGDIPAPHTLSAIISRT